MLALLNECATAFIHRLLWDSTVRPVEKGGIFPGPRDVLWAPPSLKYNEKGGPGGFFLTSICIKSIFGRNPLEELTTLPQTPSRMMRGSPPTFPSSRRLDFSTYENSDRARDNGFPGPAVALDGPEYGRLSQQQLGFLYFKGTSLHERTSFKPFCVKVGRLQVGSGKNKVKETQMGKTCRRSACDDDFMNDA